MKTKPQFWITNISKLNVSLKDLNFTIPAGVSWNLLDDKHFHFTLSQLQASAISGSIYLKSNKIKIRQVAPIVIPPPNLPISTEARYGPSRSAVQIKQVKLDDLLQDEETIMSDDKYALELLETTEKK